MSRISQKDTEELFGNIFFIEEYIYVNSIEGMVCLLFVKQEGHPELTVTIPF